MRKGGKTRLRSGFSTGTAAVAAARGALRYLLDGEESAVVAVRLPLGYYLPVPFRAAGITDGITWGSVTKDGGDDPDVTDGAEIRVGVALFAQDGEPQGRDAAGWGAAITVIAGAGVGVVTKPGLPVKIGEPAVNPVPREMLLENLKEELLVSLSRKKALPLPADVRKKPSSPFFLLPLDPGGEVLQGLMLSVTIEVPEGERLAPKTLNPRLGILGGISILGTTGLVKPFSHEAYEETIQAALSVAAACHCHEVVLSTGGKSEQYARRHRPDLAEEAFVQIADFFAFAVAEVRRLGFQSLVHSAFFGKVLKMAQGHPYTHAHRVSLDLGPLAELARGKGYERAFCRELAFSNTARHALKLLLEKGATDVVEGIAMAAVERSWLLAEKALFVRLLLFDYDGTLLADVSQEGKVGT
ncbi:MAG: cobalt-precorrin-5B (C(1))-methyltransferase [Deltaproteobacteria bacterium]|nr:cobalt-precorrin-5B (C(1))-methyltransferase [Deltaproteobacteria bacterium]